MKYLTSLFLIIILFASCKKTLDHYSISQGMKDYFVFQKGSYWIYQDSANGKLDSTTVKSVGFVPDDKGYSGLTREIYIVSCKSTFLGGFEIYGYTCEGPNYLSGGIIRNYPEDTIDNTGGSFRFYSGWQPNDSIFDNCQPGVVFLYRTFPSYTINNIVYKDIIYTKLSILGNSLLDTKDYISEIYFAKHIGLIRFVENSNRYNIHRFYNLIRYKVIQ